MAQISWFDVTAVALIVAAQILNRKLIRLNRELCAVLRQAVETANEWRSMSEEWRKIANERLAAYEEFKALKLRRDSAVHTFDIGHEADRN